MSNPPVKMEVDNPILKRSNSAPMINELSSTLMPSTTTATTSRDSVAGGAANVFAPCGGTRVRRFSASGCAFGPASPSSSSPRLTPRVNQLRREECLERETAHERELNNTMVMSQSWEDLTIVGTSPKGCGEGGDRSSDKDKGRAVGVCDPLILNLPSLSPLPLPLCSSPSPTRALNARQVFSPTLFGRANLSPSPTRKFTTRRSLSPIAMRPSTLCPVKRKFELEDGNEPMAKRQSMGLLMPHSRFDMSGGSLSSVGTPESISSADSPGGFGYRPPDSPGGEAEARPGGAGPAVPADHPMRDLAAAEASAS